MSVTQKALVKVGQALSVIGQKALAASRMRHPGAAFMLFGPGGLRPGIAEMLREIGDGTTSDVFMTPMRWIWKAITEAPIVVVDEDDAPQRDAALQGLIDKPNEFYALEHLLAATVYSLGFDGNAYWILTSDGNGDVTDVWYEPHTNVEPKWPDSGKKFISHYVYRPGGGDEIVLDVDDVIHFRDGIDPQNLRLGLSPIKAILREIWTDDEAAMFVAALLKNGGIPGLIISPRNAEDILPDEEIKIAEAKFESKFTRSGRGRVLGLTGPVSVEQFGFDPKSMDLSSIRDVSEERVCAALGVPAAVVGFGAGLQTAKVGATMRELVQLAWTGGVLPLQRIIASELTRSLAEDGQKVIFDTSEIEALRESADAVAARMRGLVRDGIFTRAQALTEMGFEPQPTDDVFLLRGNVIEVPVGRTLAEMTPQNGNGGPPDGGGGSGGAGNGGGDAPGGAGDVGGEEGDDDAQEGQRAALRDAMERKRHSLTERRIVSAAPRARTIPQRVADFASEMDRIRRDAPLKFQARIEEFFDGLAEDVTRAALEALQQTPLADRPAATQPEQSASPSITFAEEKQAEPFPGLDSLVDEIIAGANLPIAEAELAELYGLQYLSIAQETIGAMVSTMGIGIVLTEPEQVEIIRQGGLRAGLLDISAQVKESLFEALAEGRAEGLGGDNLARKIRDSVRLRPDQVRANAALLEELSGAVPGDTVARMGGRFSVTVPADGLSAGRIERLMGRYTDLQVRQRATMIARTESAHAANTATLTSAKSLPRTEHVLVTDDRLGFGDTDCVLANGVVVTIGEANAMGLAHPHCTRAFTPVNDTLMRELNLETVGQDLRLVDPI